MCFPQSLSKLGWRSRAVTLMAQPTVSVLPAVHDFLCLQAQRNVLLAEAVFKSII